jgi:RNA recognition motif-containing protein
MNIYVSNLSFNTNDAELNELFSQFGEVSSAKVIMDRESGRSRGFGFVEMPNDGEGKEAMAGLNNKEVEGRAMSVSIAKEREERGSGGGSRGGYSNNRGGSGGGGGYSSNRGGGSGGGNRW